MPYLVLDSGEGSRIQVLVTKQGIRIGRDPSCDLVVPSEAASRHHATVRLDGSRCLFHDEGSHNGSLVNGVAMRDKALVDGDRIGIGGFFITYLVNDPYGDDSVLMPIVKPSEATAAAPVDAPTADEPVVEESAPESPPTVPRRGHTKLILLAVAAVVMLLVLGLVGLVAWKVMARARSGIARPAAARATWRDGSATLEVAIPEGFHRADETAQGVRLLGPSRGKYASAISLAVEPAASGVSAGSEMDMAERSLQGQFGGDYRRVSSGDVSVGGRPARFLIYQRQMADGLQLQHWLVLAVADGRRVTLRLTCEVGEWAQMEGDFRQMLQSARVGAPATAPPATTVAPLAPPTP